MISPADLEGRLEFTNSAQKASPCSIQLTSEVPGKNSCYALMFRLFDSDLKNNFDKIEECIQIGDYDSAHTFLADIFIQ
jgi:hypothetical protein